MQPSVADQQGRVRARKTCNHRLRVIYLKCYHRLQMKAVTGMRPSCDGPAPAMTVGVFRQGGN
jgi:hypothetical protein